MSARPHNKMPAPEVNRAQPEKPPHYFDGNDMRALERALGAAGLHVRQGEPRAQIDRMGPPVPLDFTAALEATALEYRKYYVYRFSAETWFGFGGKGRTSGHAIAVIADHFAFAAAKLRALAGDPFAGVPRATPEAIAAFPPPSLSGRRGWLTPRQKEAMRGLEFGAAFLGGEVVRVDVLEGTFDVEWGYRSVSRLDVRDAAVLSALEARQ